MPVQEVQSGSQPAQVASAVPPQAAVWYWPAPQTLQLAQIASAEPPQAPVWYWPAPQTLQLAQAVSCVGVQAPVWNCPIPQVVQATQAFPARWKPGAQAVHVVASLHAAQPAGQAAQAVSAVEVQAAVWYRPTAQVVQAVQATPLPVKPGLQA